MFHVEIGKFRSHRLHHLLVILVTLYGSSLGIDAFLPSRHEPCQATGNVGLWSCRVPTLGRCTVAHVCMYVDRLSDLPSCSVHLGTHHGEVICLCNAH
jgi:hypothetical protein